MITAISTDAHFQAWMTASEGRRVAAHAALTGAGNEIDGADEGRALTITAAAAKAGCSRTLIYKSLKAGTLRAFVPFPGGNPRLTERELARWLAARPGGA